LRPFLVLIASLSTALVWFGWNSLCERQGCGWWAVIVPRGKAMTRLEFSLLQGMLFSGLKKLFVVLFKDYFGRKEFEIPPLLIENGVFGGATWCH